MNEPHGNQESTAHVMRHDLCGPCMTYPWSSKLILFQKRWLRVRILFYRVSISLHELAEGPKV
jgi:hypothetical protein